MTIGAIDAAAALHQPRITGRGRMPAVEKRRGVFFELVRLNQKCMPHTVFVILIVNS